LLRHHSGLCARREMYFCQPEDSGFQRTSSAKLTSVFC
jgi:hypothetical protein